MTQYAYDPYLPARQTNGLGIAGFICSLVGLVATGGLLSPIGLILSLVALGKQPRGFAIAGVILGLIGSCLGLFIALAFGAVILAALGFATLAAFAFSEPQKLEVTTDMVQIAMAVEKYRETNRYLPASLDMLALDSQVLTDPWGINYRYEQKDPQREFDLVTAGEDKQFDTKDDARLSKIDEMWQMSKGVRISHRGGNGGAVKIDIGGRTIEVIGDKPTESPGDKPADDAADDAGEEKSDEAADNGGGGPSGR